MNGNKKGSTREEVRQAMQAVGNETPLENKLVGGAGGLGFVTGTAAKAATGAFNLIKSILRGKTKQVPIIGKPGKTISKPTLSSTKQVSYANPRISMTRAQREAAGY